MAAPETRAVLDASCFLRAVLDDLEDAQRWMDALGSGSTEALSSELLYAEVSHALVRQTRLGLIAPDYAVRVVREVAELPIRSTPCRLLAEPSYAMALEHGVTAYDAQYLALAEAEDAVLVTADRGLAAAASRGILLD